LDAFIVGLALDTNGGNFRHKIAADHHGDDPVIRALIVGKQDIAGVASRFKAAADKVPGIRIRSAHKTTAYMHYPSDITWNSRTEREVKRLFREADVVHLNNSPHAYRKLDGPELRKPAVLHHHGTSFRNGAPALLAKAHTYSMVQAVSTIDLLRKAPDELTWLPIPYDLDMLDVYRRNAPVRADGRIRVVSCPTNRGIKSTAALEAAIDELQAEGLAVDLELVENQRWTTSLAAKGQADIYFDQVGLGYGCNAIEAWGMGVPVIAGADLWTLEAMAREFGTSKLPFYPADERTIADAIRALVLSADLRAEYGQRGLAHARRFHAELPALERLVDLYLAAIGRRATRQRIGEDRPGSFRSTYPKLRIRLDDSTTVRFAGGRLEAGPGLAWKLRDAIAGGRTRNITEVDSEGLPVAPLEELVEVGGGDALPGDLAQQADEGGQLDVAVPDAPDEAVPGEHLKLALGVAVVPTDRVDEVGLLEASR